MAYLSKKMRALRETVSPNKVFDLGSALDMIKRNTEKAARKFNETVEVAVRLGIDPRQSDQAVRGMVALPHGTGRTVRVAVFARGEKADAARAAGADVVGAEDLAERIQEGFMAFDRVIAAPDLMGVVGKLGKILGTRGLMPNPKLGTVTANVADAVKTAKAGSVEFRAEKGGIVHAAIGKADFSVDALVENARALLAALVRARPAGVRGTYINAMSVSSTMGIGVDVDVSSVDTRAQGS